MRNISIVSVPSFESYSINCGEYSYSVNLAEVVKALAKAFETPLDDVREAFQLILTLGSDCYTKIAPSEHAVLVDLCEFASAILTNPEDSSCTFVYFNCNTGAKVVWNHMVC